MAQGKKKNAKKKKASATAKPRLTPDDARTAVAHVIEVAAAAEGWGLDTLWGDDAVLTKLGWPDERRRDARGADRAFLEQVVELVRKHRSAQRRHQRDALLAHLAILLIPPVKHYAEAARAEKRRVEKATRRNDPEAVRAAIAPLRARAQDQVRAILLGYYIKATADDLDLLVPELDDLAKLDGPARAVCERLGKFAGDLCQDWVHRIKKTPHVLDDARFSAGAWVPLSAAARYAQDVFKYIRTKTETPEFQCMDLKGLSEGLGLMLDRRVENVVATLLSDPALVAGYYRYCLVEHIKGGAEVPPDAAPEQRALVMACVDAENQGDVDAARLAAGNLERAMLPEFTQRAGQLREQVDQVLGPLDTLPPLPAGAAGPGADLKAHLRKLLDRAFATEEATPR